MQPSLGKEELEALKKVFESNWIGKGNKVKEFEKEYSKHINSSIDNVLSTNCCSEGLFSSMKIFDIGQNDEVIIPTISFVGAANAVCASGAKLVMCDVDKRTLNARAEDIEKKITNKTKAIILLHYGGIPCEMDEIMALSKKYNIKVIEDCAAGVCSEYKGKALGTIGDMGMWSFDSMKILVCGDGAILHFNDINLKNKAEKLLYFGMEVKSGYENSVAQKWWEFDVSCFGHRAIMNDMTAAVALEQLKKLPQFMKRRKEINDYYDDSLKNINWIDLPTPIESYCKTSYYFYHIQCQNDTRDKLAKYLRENNIYTTYRYFPLHRVKKYEIDDYFPNADYAADNTLCLPIHQGLTNQDVEYIVNKIKEFDKKING